MEGIIVNFIVCQAAVGIVMSIANFFVIEFTKIHKFVDPNRFTHTWIYASFDEVDRLYEDVKLLCRFLLMCVALECCLI